MTYVAHITFRRDGAGSGTLVLNAGLIGRQRTLFHLEIVLILYLHGIRDLFLPWRFVMEI